MSPTHNSTSNSVASGSNSAISSNRDSVSTPENVTALNNNENNLTTNDGNKTSNNSNKDIQGFCDSSSSNSSFGCNNSNNTNFLQQSAQNNQHNHTNNKPNSDDHTGNSASKSGTADAPSRVSIGKTNESSPLPEIFIGAGINIKNIQTSCNSNNGEQVIVGISDKEAKLLGIISTFLHVHPFGASLDYIWSYAQKVIPGVNPNQIEVLLSKFPTLFKREVSGIGATFERKWVFVGFT